jgi:hypothetical protein
MMALTAFVRVAGKLYRPEPWRRGLHLNDCIGVRLGITCGPGGEVFAMYYFDDPERWKGEM